ncbi:MAG TPA: DUF1707 domain-containing protein [Solirubrobacteraceae bacterium]|nr:DUF1707 domain-containing protein [Solirubrobacteraceae bacterium]
MSERDTGPPALRASDADRERVAAVLREAAGDGRLDLDELDERLQAAYAARTHEELGPLTADLQAPAGMPMPSAASREVGFSVKPGEGGARWLVSFMGGVTRKGRWRLSPNAMAINVMGGSDLDLNEVELGAERVELTVLSLMGGSSIRVPHGLKVEVSEFAVMGGNDVVIDDETPPAPGPVLTLRLLSIMGGTDVKRGPKLSRAERKARREQRRLERRGQS